MRLDWQQGFKHRWQNIYVLLCYDFLFVRFFAVRLVTGFAELLMNMKFALYLMHQQYVLLLVKGMCDHIREQRHRRFEHQQYIACEYKLHRLIHQDCLLSARSFSCCFRSSKSTYRRGVCGSFQYLPAICAQVNTIYGFLTGFGFLRLLLIGIGGFNDKII